MAAPEITTENINKVILGNDVRLDLSSDTVTPDKLASGITAHDNSGAKITGTMEMSSVKLQPSKSVTVTQNGTVSVNPDSGYNGLKKVDVTVNVPSSINKLQPSKSITVTQNGTISVSPDNGYDGLKKADITVNVPSSGGTDLKTMIISFEVLTTGEDNHVSLYYVNKNGEYTEDFFDDFSSSNIIEIEVADPSFIIISTPSSCQYDNIEYDFFGNNGTYADTDYGGGSTHLLIILTQFMRETWKTSRVVLSLD